jgi:hypothetical protein
MNPVSFDSLAPQSHQGAHEHLALLNYRQQPRGPVEIIPSAARTSTFNTADIVNPGYRGALFLLHVTAASGTGGLVMYLYGRAYSDYFLMAQAPAVAVTTISSVAGSPSLGVRPGCSQNTGVTPNFNFWPVYLPPVYWLRVYAVDASSYTYSVSVTYFP